jgi:hypothetical protein
MCQPGTLQGYINLGAGGCDLGAAHINDFMIEPGQSFATPIDPATIQVTPDGTDSAPSLVFNVGATAGPFDLLESFFRFNVAAQLSQAFISLGSPSATGNGVVVGVLDVCAGGSFPDGVPTNCPGNSDSRVVFATATDSQLADSVSFPITSFFDVFVDLTADGGLNGTALLNSATVGVGISAAAVPEPSMALGLAAVLGAMIFYKIAPQPARELSEAMNMRLARNVFATVLAGFLALPPSFAANHREAPITALDPKADITDVFAFRSYDGGSTPRVTLVLCVDPLLEPGNGPNWFPFDPDILYEIKIDNNNDAVEDITFQFALPRNSACRICFRSMRGRGPA